MPLNQADRLLDSMVRKNKLAAEVDARPRSRLAGLFRRERAPVPFTAEPPAAKRDRRSDLTVAALGVTLGLICALFPWYIFFNPDEFGVRAMKFGGNGAIGDTGPIMLGSQPQRVGAPSTAQEIPPMKLDLLATGTARKEGAEEEHGTPGLTEQPFPALPIAFKLVHIANGRAMIEDDSGLFIVQRGSVLPDSSRVESIEERSGRWVLVTDAGLVLEVQE